MTACQAKVTPAGNRMLVFTTTFDSFHGHPDPLTCPEDVARRSMALYYFTEEEQAVRRSTNYQARPDESACKKAAIWADRRALDLYDRVKRRLGISDEAASEAAGAARRPASTLSWSASSAPGRAAGGRVPRSPPRSRQPAPRRRPQRGRCRDPEVLAAA